MYEMEQARRTSPSSRRRDNVEQKPYHRQFPNNHLYSEPGRAQQFTRRRPALSDLYGRHQHRDRLGCTKRSFPKDRVQQPSTIRPHADRSVKFDPVPLSSTASAMMAPQSTENRNQFIHPKLIGRFVPASKVKQEKQDTETPESTPELSEVLSDFSNGSNLAVSQLGPVNKFVLASECLPPKEVEILESTDGAEKGNEKEQFVLQDSFEAKRTSSRNEWSKGWKQPSNPVEGEVQSSIEGREVAIDLQSDVIATEGSVRCSNGSQGLLLQAERGSLASIDGKIDENDGCEAKVGGNANQSNSSIPQSSKKGNNMEFLPGEYNEFCKIKVKSRVAVYWDGEDEFFEGTVTRERENQKRRFFIEYDDGDREWIDLSKQRFRLLELHAKRKSDHSLSAHDAGSYSSRSEDIPDAITAIGIPKQSIAPKLIQKTRQVTSSESCDEKSPEGMVGHHRSCPTYREDMHCCGDWVLNYNNPELHAEPGSSDDSETDEEELMEWAATMFGIRPVARPEVQSTEKPRSSTQTDYSSTISTDQVYGGISEAVKRRRSCAIETSNAQEAEKTTFKSTGRSSANPTNQAKKTKRSKSGYRVRIRNSIPMEKPIKNDSERDIEVEAKRKKELARALTTEEIKSILGEEDCLAPCSTHWVRRSVRQPSKYALNSPRIKDLIEKLKCNDPDMVVLKMKKYVNDPNTPCLVIDAVLAALEENTNCEALYIQVSHIDRGLLIFERFLT